MPKRIRKINSADDIIPIQSIIQQLVGKLCWRVKQSYGDELVLQIGDTAPDPLPERTHSIAGHFRVCTRGTDYTIYKGAETWVNLDSVLDESPVESDAIMKWMTHILSGLHVLASEVTYPDLALIITFENDISLVVRHDKSKPSYYVADWEIVMWDSGKLSVGPKMKWSWETYKQK